MLSRKVVTRSGRGYRGYFPSRKLGRMVAWESLLERDLILLLEYSPGVSFYQEQPSKIEYWDGSSFRTYFPDFYLTAKDGSSRIVEVKPESELKRYLVSEKLKAIAAHFADRGEAFQIADESVIRCEPLLSNLKRIAYLATKPKSEQPTLVDKAGLWPCRYAELRDEIGERAVWSLLAQRRLWCDLRVEIEDDSMLTLGEGGQHAEIYL